MTEEERTIVHDRTVVEPTVQPAAPGDPVVAASTRTTERTTVPPGPSGATMARRVVTFLFGILQAALIIRIILLLLVADPDNDVVALILGITDPFVEPFRGMFALDRVTADQGSVLDIAAVVALIAWTLIELLVLAAIRLFDRRDSRTVRV